MRRLKKGWLLLIAACVAGPALAVDLPAGTRWAQPHFARLDVQFPGQGFHARWDFWNCACGDAMIRAEETLPEGVIKGELLLVNGRVLLARGYDGQAGDRRNMLDSPLLMLQLLFALMEKTAPGGPAAVNERVDLKHHEERFPLMLVTPTAEGGFPAPWDLEGIAYRFTDGTHRFDLDFSFEIKMVGQAATRSEIDLSGMLDFQPRDFPVTGEEKLEGWQVLPLLDDEAPFYSAGAPATLAELRELVRQRKKGE